MTKLTPEQVEEMERSLNQCIEHYSRLQTGSGMIVMRPDTILTLCREWRGRGEALRNISVCRATQCKGCRKEAIEALGADHED